MLGIFEDPGGFVVVVRKWPTKNGIGEFQDLKKKRIFKDSEGFASRLAVKTREDPENSNPKGFLKGFPKISKNLYYV